ncbi:MAG: SDR family oxidoreductase [Bacteroidales bacterium]|nr:SDR family oxidoreductase [Bacteroidales bacterium]
MTDVIITGAGKGIGFSLVEEFVKLSGYRILVISRNIGKLKKFDPETVISASIDLGKADAISSILHLIGVHSFAPEILINNAGLLINKAFQDLSPADFDAVFHINVKAPFLLSQALLPHFRPNAHIVNIGSMGGFQGSAKFAGLSLYSASKAALATLSECMAEEFKNLNIKVNCLALGAARTEMLAEAFPGYHAPVSADEMARFIAGFAQNGHHFFNGKILPVSLSTP